MTLILADAGGEFYLYLSAPKGLTFEAFVGEDEGEALAKGGYLAEEFGLYPVKPHYSSIATWSK